MRLAHSGLLRAIRTAMLFAFDTLAMLVPVQRRKVTLVLRLDAIGDFFLWLQSGADDVAEAARENGHLSVLAANRAWAEYAGSSGSWDRVVPVDPVRMMREPLYRFRLLVRLRRLGAAVLLQPRHARVFLQEDAIARVCGATRRVGSAGTFINLTPLSRRCGNRYYHELVPVDEGRSVHETLRNGRFALYLTGRPARRHVFPEPPGGACSGSIAVAVGAGQAGRVWPLENLAELILHIRGVRPDAVVRLLGAPAERERARRIEELVGPGIDNRIGTTSLTDLVRIIGGAELVICNDSSAFHIAMALERRVLCFLGGGHFGWYAPYPDADASRAIVLHESMDCFWCNWRCRFPTSDAGAFLCVSSIPVGRAVAAADFLLGTSRCA